MKGFQPHDCLHGYQRPSDTPGRVRLDSSHDGASGLGDSFSYWAVNVTHWRLQQTANGQVSTFQLVGLRSRSGDQCKTWGSLFVYSSRRTYFPSDALSDQCFIDKNCKYLLWKSIYGSTNIVLNINFALLDISTVLSVYDCKEPSCKYVYQVV